MDDSALQSRTELSDTTEGLQTQTRSVFGAVSEDASIPTSDALYGCKECTDSMQQVRETIQESLLVIGWNAVSSVAMAALLKENKTHIFGKATHAFVTCTAVWGPSGVQPARLYK